MIAVRGKGNVPDIISGKNVSFIALMCKFMGKRYIIVLDLVDTGNVVPSGDDVLAIWSPFRLYSLHVMVVFVHLNVLVNASLN